MDTSQTNDTTVSPGLTLSDLEQRYAAIQNQITKLVREAELAAVQLHQLQGIQLYLSAEIARLKGGSTNEQQKG